MQRLRNAEGSMTCHIGKHKVEEVIVLDAPTPDGALGGMGCEDCWRKLGLWCDLHNLGHQGFVGRRSTCLACIEEEVVRRERFGAPFLAEARKVFPQDDLEELDDWLIASSLATGQAQAICFLRLLATEALLAKTSVKKVMQRLKEERSVLEVLPPILF